MPIKKAVKLTDKEICDKWLVNKNINPETSKKIKETGEIYKKLEKKCLKKTSKTVKLSDKEICDKWLVNKNINPETSKKIKETGEIYKKLEKKCLDKNSIKIKAYKKIYKLFIPYIKRTSINIIDRINYFIIIKKNLMKIKNKNNCVRLYNIDEKTKQIKYRIGTNIILDKRIGSDSNYGIVYLSHLKSENKYGNKFDKLNKFAVKITNDDIDNKKEIKILELLTKKVLELKCPHFPICYGSFKCDDSDLSSNNPDDYSIVKDKKDDKSLFPELVNINKSLLIQINELASGDLEYYLEKNTDTNTDKLNTLTQILLSIMFFHNYTNSYHNDCHQGNFLYHKIKPGGYFHYNIYGIDYYLENKGYLWVIWDFGFTENYKYTSKPINYDFVYLLDAIDYYRKYFSNTEFAVYYNLLYNHIKYKYDINDFNYLYYIYKEILDYLIINVKSFTTIKPSNIINKQPYIITGQKPLTDLPYKKNNNKVIMDYVKNYILRYKYL